MTGKTHQLLGMTVGLGSYLSLQPASYGPATLAAVLVISHLAALLPDLDHPAAEIWQQLPGGKMASQVVDSFLKHRNISHSILGTVIAVYIFWRLLLLAPTYWGLNQHALLLAFALAYLSHLLADAVTVEGIPLFFPYGSMLGFPPYPLDGLRIVTGKWFENLILFPLINLCFLALIIIEWPKIHQILFH